MEPRRPNIILIHCHDLGRWLPSYGLTGIHTPALDALAAAGIVFDNAFATAPLCTPARSSLFTGLLPHQNGLMGLAHAGWTYHDQVRTLPQELSEVGYRTALIGLQHEDLDARTLGYDEVHGLGFIPRALEVAKLFRAWVDSADTEQPFFASVGVWEVHRPWPVEDYQPADPADVDVPAYLPDNPHTREDIAEFYGAVAQLDDAIGQILSALDASPHADETLVLFTTDHGAAFPRAKSTLYDSGTGVTLIARPPAHWGITTSRAAEIVSHLDILPTCLELAGAAVPDGLEGRSFAPLLHDDALPAAMERELVMEKTFHDGYDPSRALRTRHHKYIQHYRDGKRLPLPIDLEQSRTRAGLGSWPNDPRPPHELYLLDTDPDELHNVADVPDNADLVRHLQRRLNLHLHRTADPVLDGDITAPEPPTTRRAPNPVR